MYQDVVRAKGYKDDSVHFDRSNDPLQIGQQVFMDILLLAKCNYFLHAESNVASLASYFNPEMKSFFLGDVTGNQKVKTRNTKLVTKGYVNLI